MDPEKVGKFIKKIRKENNLTQKELGDKYYVTYQAVSKWENGINLPEVSLIRQMSKDFNVSIEDILDGEINNKKKKKKIWGFIIVFLIITFSLFFLFKDNNSDSFEFKTLSTSCQDFNVTGSLAYDRDKSSIYISHINYCGGNDTIMYKEIECNLYEKDGNILNKISTCKNDNSNIKLEEFLKNVSLNIDNYSKTCKNYTDDSLLLEVNATDYTNKTTTYKIPLKLNDNCQK